MGGMRSIMTIGLIASDPQAVPEVSSSSPRFSSAGLHWIGDDPADHDPDDPAHHGSADVRRKGWGGNGAANGAFWGGKYEPENWRKSWDLSKGLHQIWKTELIFLARSAASG